MPAAAVSDDGAASDVVTATPISAFLLSDAAAEEGNALFAQLQRAVHELPRSGKSAKFMRMLQAKQSVTADEFRSVFGPRPGASSARDCGELPQMPQVPLASLFDSLFCGNRANKQLPVSRAPDQQQPEPQ